MKLKDGSKNPDEIFKNTRNGGERTVMELWKVQIYSDF